MHRYADAGIDLAPFANHVSARLLDIQTRTGPTCDCDGAACIECQAVRNDEHLAVACAKKLFGAGYANLRSSSVSQAVEVVHTALLQDGDTVLDVAGLRQGLGKTGHRNRGHSGKIDYDGLQEVARKDRPRIISARFPDVCRAVDFSVLRSVADEIEAWLHIDITPVAGLIAAGLYANPVGVADVVTAATDGSLRGPAGGMVLARLGQELAHRIDQAAAGCQQTGASMAAQAQALKEALEDGFVSYQCSVISNAAAMAEVFAAAGHDIVGNRNHDASFTIRLRDADKATQLEARLRQCGIHAERDTSCTPGATGLRIGAAAITTRGFGLAEAKSLAALVCGLLLQPDDALTAARVRREVGRLRRKFPVPA